MNKRFLTIYRNAEVGEPSGGVAQVSTPQTDSSQSASAGSPSPGANEGQANQSQGAGDSKYTQEYFEGLEKLGSSELDSLTDKDLEAYDKWSTSGRKASQPSTPKPETAPEKKDGSVETPKTETDIQKILEGKSANKWTAEEAQAIADAMAAVGAKTPQELLAKNKEALSLAGRKGQEEGNLRKELDQYTQFFNDLADGKPEAIKVLQKLQPKLTYAQAQAIAENMQQPTAPGEDSDAIPEGVIDEAGFRAARKMFKAEVEAIKAESAKLREQLEAVVGKTEQERAQLQQERQRDAAYQGYIEQALSLAAQYPEEFQIQSGNLRQLLMKHYYEGVTDPRLGNFLDLAKFAYDGNFLNGKTGLIDLEVAYLVKNKESFTKKLIAAKQAGRDEVLNQGRSQGLAGVRNNPSGGNPQTYTLEDAAAMARGDKDAPKEWFTAGMLDQTKVPAHLREKIFGRSIR